MSKRFIDWLIFIILSFIWGSSFILMKEGLIKLSAFQVASIRIISSGLVLLPIAFRSFKDIPKNKLLTVFMSGVLGNLIPAYLFCIAEQGVSSALAGVLNSLTPIFVIIVGSLFFQSSVSANKVIGILIAFSGSFLLFLNQPGFAQQSNALYVLLIAIATICYGINVNMVGRHLGNIPSLKIVAVALSLNAIPALIVLIYSGFFRYDLKDTGLLAAIGYSSVLGVLGTAVASIMFYMLIKRAGAVFSSMVTYGIPMVAMGWGIVYGEKVGWKDAVCLLLILAGVYVANKRKQIN